MNLGKITQNLKLLFFSCKENNFRAFLLRGDVLFHLVLALFILRILILPFYIHFPKSIFFAKIVTSDILELLNRQRRFQGLPVLTEDPKLKRAAFLKAQDMLVNDYFGHESPAGISGWYWIQKSGYNYEIAGENLAIGFLDSEEVHQAWNNSALHKSNLLDSRFQDVGIVVLRGEFQGNETTVVVQLFGKPKEKPILKEEIVPPVEAKVLEKEEILVEEPLPVAFKGVESLQFNFWEFLITKYNQIAQKLVFFVALLIISVLTLSLLLTIRLTLPLKMKILLLREYLPASLLAIFVLILLSFLDKSIILQFIPHELEINSFIIKL